jgi:hypothetical protein
VRGLYSKMPPCEGGEVDASSTVLTKKDKQ